MSCSGLVLTLYGRSDNPFLCLPVFGTMSTSGSGPWSYCFYRASGQSLCAEYFVCLGQIVREVTRGGKLLLQRQLGRGRPWRLGQSACVEINQPAPRRSTGSGQAVWVVGHRPQPIEAGASWSGDQLFRRSPEPFAGAPLLKSSFRTTVPKMSKYRSGNSCWGRRGNCLYRLFSGASDFPKLIWELLSPRWLLPY